MSKATTDALGSLHGVVAAELERRIQSGEASAADLGAAIKFLKDNEITADLNTSDHLKGLQNTLAERAQRREARRLKLVPEAGPLTEEEVTELKEASGGA